MTSLFILPLRHEEGQHHRFLWLLLEGTHDVGGEQSSDKTDEQPRNPVEKAASNGFLACAAGLRSTPKQATHTIHVLLVLPQQHGQESVRRDEAHEIALLVHHREGALSGLYSSPSSDLLISAWSDYGRIGIHRLPRGDLARSREEALYRQLAH
jgi:hypothetical protein